MTHFPLARSRGLVVQQSKNETLVYDQLSHDAHCLSEIAGQIWKLCDGRRDAAELAKSAEQSLRQPVGPELVQLALHELGQVGLLEGVTPAGEQQRKQSRRELCARLFQGAAAVMLVGPMVTSARAHTAEELASIAVLLDQQCRTTAAGGTTTAPVAGTTPAATTASPTTTAGTTTPPRTTQPPN